MKIIVYHSDYGCDSGCCGHYVEIDGHTAFGRFSFDHPDRNETPRQFAERMVREKMGEEHVKDLDWDNCVITDD